VYDSTSRIQWFRFESIVSEVDLVVVMFVIGSLSVVVNYHLPFRAWRRAWRTEGGIGTARVENFEDGSEISQVGWQA
jgi:hypothetical protein